MSGRAASRRERADAPPSSTHAHTHTHTHTPGHGSGGLPIAGSYDSSSLDRPHGIDSTPGTSRPGPAPLRGILKHPNGPAGAPPSASGASTPPVHSRSVAQAHVRAGTPSSGVRGVAGASLDVSEARTRRPAAASDSESDARARAVESAARPGHTGETAASRMRRQQREADRQRLGLKAANSAANATPGARRPIAKSTVTQDIYSDEFATSASDGDSESVMLEAARGPPREGPPAASAHDIAGARRLGFAAMVQRQAAGIDPYGTLRSEASTAASTASTADTTRTLRETPQTPLPAALQHATPGSARRHFRAAVSAVMVGRSTPSSSRRGGRRPVHHPGYGTVDSMISTAATYGTLTEPLVHAETATIEEDAAFTPDPRAQYSAFPKHERAAADDLTRHAGTAARNAAYDADSGAENVTPRDAPGAAAPFVGSSGNAYGARPRAETVRNVPDGSPLPTRGAPAYPPLPTSQARRPTVVEGAPDSPQASPGDTASVDMYGDFTTQSTEVSPCGGAVVYGVASERVAHHTPRAARTPPRNAAAARVDLSAGLSAQRSQGRFVMEHVDMDTPEPPPVPAALPAGSAALGASFSTPQRPRAASRYDAGLESAGKSGQPSLRMLSPAARAAARALYEYDVHGGVGAADAIGRSPPGTPASGLRQRHRPQEDMAGNDNHAATTHGARQNDVTRQFEQHRSPARRDGLPEESSPRPHMSARRRPHDADNTPLAAGALGDVTGSAVNSFTTASVSPVKLAARMQLAAIAGPPPSSGSKALHRTPSSARRGATPLTERQGGRSPATGLPNFHLTAIHEAPRLSAASDADHASMAADDGQESMTVRSRRPSTVSQAAAASTATVSDSAVAVASGTGEFDQAGMALPPLAEAEADSSHKGARAYRPSTALNEDEYDFAIVVRAFAGGKRQAAALARAKAQADAIAAAHAQQTRLFGGGRPEDEETVVPDKIAVDIRNPIAAAAPPAAVTTRSRADAPAPAPTTVSRRLRSAYGSSSLDDALAGADPHGVTAVKEASRRRAHHDAPASKRKRKGGRDLGARRSRKSDHDDSDSASLSDSDEMSDSSDDSLPSVQLELQRHRAELQADTDSSSEEDTFGDDDDDRGLDDIESVSGYYSAERSSRRSSVLASVAHAAARTWRAARQSILGRTSTHEGSASAEYNGRGDEDMRNRKLGERRVTWSGLPVGGDDEKVDINASKAAPIPASTLRARIMMPAPSQRTVDSDVGAVRLPPGAFRLTDAALAVPDEAAAAAYEEALITGRVHKCAEVLAALRAAGLRAKRIRSLSRRVWLIKVCAPEWRLEIEAERLRLRMRRRDGGWSRFKRSMRSAFLPTIPEDESAVSAGRAGAFASEDDRLSDSGFVGVNDDVENAHGKHGQPHGRSLFHSSDRQTLIDHILRCSSREGGADLGQNSPLGAFVEHMFPLHMYARLTELRSDWLAIWRPPRSDPEHDRIGVVLDGWYAEPRLVDLSLALPSGASAAKLPSAPSKTSALAVSSTATPHDDADPREHDKHDSAHRVRGNKRASGSCCGECGCVGRLLVASMQCVVASCCKCRRSTRRLCCGVLSQPLDRIAAYYGETVAFYFAWLQFYTTWLILPSIAGVLLFFGQIMSGTLDIAYVPLFSLFMALWSAMFLEFWKRRNAHLSQRWGVFNYEDEEVVRPQFQGTWKQDVRSGVVLRVYPAWKRGLKFAISVPMILIFVCAVMMFMVFVFSTRDRLLSQLEAYDLAFEARAAVLSQYNGHPPSNVTVPPEPTLQFDVWRSIVDAWNGGLGGFFSGAATSLSSSGSSNADGTIGSTHVSVDAVATKLAQLRHFFTAQHDWRWWLAMTVPPIVYGCMMPFFDWVFNKLALYFNDWENHVTESEYRNHRIAKVFFYRFMACFVSLFYYAFSPSQSLQALFVQLAAFLIVGQLFNNFLEVLSNSTLRCWRECRFSRLVKRAEESGLGEGRRGNRLLRHAQSQAWAEARLPLYDTFHDYAELLIQYGYVTFFSWAFPLAPLCALINNVIEMRTDAYRLCYLTQRPIAHKAGGIGVWYNVLMAMSMLAVLTNCAHLALSSRQFQVYFPNMTDAQRLLIIFVFEHLVLSLRFVIGYVIPAVPASVKRRAQRDAFALARLQGRRSIGSIAS